MKRLPHKQVTMPGGFRIHLIYKTQRQMAALGEKDSYGYWQYGHDGGKLVLNKEVPIWRQLRTYGHEMVHAINDYKHWIDLHVDCLKAEDERLQKELADDAD